MAETMEAKHQDIVRLAEQVREETFAAMAAGALRPSAVINAAPGGQNRGGRRKGLVGVTDDEEDDGGGDLGGQLAFQGSAATRGWGPELDLAGDPFFAEPFASPAVEESFVSCWKPSARDIRLLYMLGPEKEALLASDCEKILEYFHTKHMSLDRLNFGGRKQDGKKKGQPAQPVLDEEEQKVAESWAEDKRQSSRSRRRRSVSNAATAAPRRSSAASEDAVGHSASSKSATARRMSSQNTARGGANSSASSLLLPAVPGAAARAEDGGSDG